ncbi:MAG: non-canonical purine NTP pyrophosphatase [Chloroflexota bacterium]|nr:non-canonical purine NTP pyrophosphatase [Chloroflexota bacterium]
MSRLLVATNNAGKQEEFKRLLAELRTEIVTPADIGIDLVPDEPHDTYAENAAAKADAFCRASRLPTLADDAGIEVAALGWGPGVRTARYAAGSGLSGVQHLLRALEGVEDRRARMVCWLAVASPDDPSRIELFSGTMEGEVAHEPHGDAGFGFDPVFRLPEGMTNAELPPAEKDARSHRGRAIAAAMPHLRMLLAER